MIIIIGGGLAGCLLSYRLLQMKSPPDFLLIDDRDSLDHGQTWSFQHSDIEPQSYEWVQPLIRKSWDSQEVRFSQFQKIFENTYHSVTSQNLAQGVNKVVGSRLILKEHAQEISAQSVTLKNGTKIPARVVIDARGADFQLTESVGYQKFYGVDVELDAPHGVTRPVIMDADCDQKGDYRFFYLLPWSKTSLLIEDTRYSNSPGVDKGQYEKEILAYCKQSGWRVKEILRREVGCLSIPLTSPQDNETALLSAIPMGVRGGYFQATTGYSFGIAVHTVEAFVKEIEENPEWSSATLRAKLDPLRNSLRKQNRFLIMLNRMMFLAGPPCNRWKIFYRFYRLENNLIFRFYKGQLRFFDQVRILMGKPPVPLLSALRCVFSKPRISSDRETQHG
jgi:lycopene beta-cyclase